MAAANSSGAAEAGLTDHQRLAIGLVALGNQERMLALEIMAERAASPITVQALLRNAEALGEGARSGGRLGYQRGAEAALAFPFSFAAAYFFYRRFGIVRFLADRLGDRFEMLLVTRSVDPGAHGRARRAVALDFRRAGGRAHRRHPQASPQAHDSRSRRAPPAISPIRGRPRSQVSPPVRDAARDGTVRRLVPGRPHRGRGLRRPQGQRRGQKERGAASLRPWTRYARADRAPRPVRRSQRPAARAGAEAA